MSRLEGMEEMKRKLDDLGKRVGGKIARTALRDGAKVSASFLREEAPKGDGTTAAAIKVRTGKRRQGLVSMLVTIGEGSFKGLTFYAGFVNWGWIWSRHKRARVSVRKGRKTNNTTSREVAVGERKIPGTEWLEKGWDRGVDATLERVKTSLADSLEEEVSIAS